MLTIRLLHSPPMLVRSCLKSCMLGFSIMRTKNFQMSKLVLEKEEELEIKLPIFSGLQRNQECHRTRHVKMRFLHCSSRGRILRAAIVASRFLSALPRVDCGQSALNKRWSRDPYAASPWAGARRARGGPSVGERRRRGGGCEHCSLFLKYARAF